MLKACGVEYVITGHSERRTYFGDTDVTVQKRILDHLHMLTDSLGTAVLFITHDLGLAAERAQHIVVMYKGQVVESGPSLEVLQHPQHPYTKRLVAAAPSLASQRIISAKERGENADALLDHHIAGEARLRRASTSSPSTT